METMREEIFCDRAKWYFCEKRGGEREEIIKTIFLARFRF